jgi:hypothetical protein
VIVGVEEDQPEDTSDVEWLLGRLSDAAKADETPHAPPRIGGKKFKKCCGAASSPSGS